MGVTFIQSLFYGTYSAYPGKPEHLNDSAMSPLVDMAIRL
jgi:hypothetical protein